MLSLVPSTSTFKASYGRIYGFMSRYNLSLRTPTNHCTKRLGFIENQTTSNNHKSSHEYIKNIQDTKQIHNIYNVDQTPIWWNTLDPDSKTVDIERSKKVTRRIQRENPREKISVILACSQDGEMLPPAMIVSYSTTKMQPKRARIKLINRVITFINPNTSMANSDIMSRWIRIVMDMQQERDKKNILIMDSFRGHLTYHKHIKSSHSWWINFTTTATGSNCKSLYKV